MSTEAMKLALEALEELITDVRMCDDIERGERAITALQEALAQPQQEPSGWQKIVECPICGDMAIATGIPAAQRKPLTNADLGMYISKELAEYVNGAYADTGCAKDQLIHFARAIEAAHGIKEST